jgi:hypothetical protein
LMSRVLRVFLCPETRWASVRPPGAGRSCTLEALLMFGVLGALCLSLQARARFRKQMSESSTHRDDQLLQISDV